ncbi:MAG: glycosyltransferase family 4 protein [Vicinamibacterales bacterium]
MHGRRQVPLLRQLVADGVEPIVALLGDEGGMRRDLEGSGVRLEVLPVLPPPASKLLALPRAVALLRSMIARHNPDIVEGSDPLPGLVAALAGRAPSRRRRPLVIYRRHFYDGWLRMRIPSQMAARLSDRMAASCESMRRRIAAAERKPLRLIDVSTSGIAEPPIIADDEMARARESLGIAPHAFVICAVAYLCHHKGIDVLIRALEHLTSRGDIHVVIVGDGRERQRLERLASHGSIPVHFLGHREDVHRWIAIADVMVMPSRWESFGRVTIETMSMGRPLIASRIGGLHDAIVEGQTGLFVPADDPSALGAALATLVDDRARARRMGAAARAHFTAHHTIAHMATSWRHSWERAMAATTARHGGTRR